MKQQTKTNIIAAIFIIPKLAFFILTAHDTIAFVKDVEPGISWLVLGLYVVLIDVVFNGFWAVTVYGGDTDRMKLLKAFSAAGAIMFYLAILYIGYSVYDSLIALIVRLAPGVLLAYDLSDYAVSLYVAYRKRKQSITPESKAIAFRQKLNAKAYRQALQSKPVVRERKAIALRFAQQHTSEDALQYTFMSNTPQQTQSTSKRKAKQSKVEAMRTMLPDGKVQCICGETFDNGRAWGAHKRGCVQCKALESNEAMQQQSISIPESITVEAVEVKHG